VAVLNFLQDLRIIEMQRINSETTPGETSSSLPPSEMAKSCLKSTKIIDLLTSDTGFGLQTTAASVDAGSLSTGKTML
jgi:hypothetical protein